MKTLKPKKFGWHEELANIIEYFDELNQQEITKLFLRKD